MPDFSVILQSPEVRQIVQENMLAREFKDALYPRLMFRMEATPQLWPAQTGDNFIFTGVGLMAPDMNPIVPGSDISVGDYPKEQWTAQLQKYGKSIDSDMPTSNAAIASLFLRNCHQLGLHAGESLNRIVRNRLYNAALSGNTVTSAAVVASVTVPVQRLNGFTRARRPDLVAGSPVRFETVSGSNPLVVTTPAGANTVVGFSATTPGDEVGPGTLTFGAAVTLALRDFVLAQDRSTLVRVGGGSKVDDVGAGDILRLADVRSAVALLRQNNVPEAVDGRYHCHLDPVSETQIFADPEWQRLNTSLPDYYMYRDLAIGEMHGTIFYRNTVAPQATNVVGGTTATFNQGDNFAGELFNNGVPATGVPIHRALVIGQGFIYEYYKDLAWYITEAGVTGRVGEFNITNNSIEVMTERIQLIFRSPLDRAQEIVSASWKFSGDWPVRTDATSGDLQRFKRAVCIEHGS